MRDGVISYGVLATATTSASAASSRSSPTSEHDRRPEELRPNSFVDFKGAVCIIPPNSFALARTVEYFQIPRNVLTISVGKSTYARCGIITNVTPVRARVGGIRDAGDHEYDAAAREDLCERGHCPGAVLRERRGAARRRTTTRRGSTRPSTGSPRRASELRSATEAEQIHQHGRRRPESR